MIEYAFPQSVRTTEKYLDEAGYARERSVLVNSGGLNLRDYFAAKAMAGLIANAHIAERYGKKQDAIAKEAYRHADEMMKVRNQND